MRAVLLRYAAVIVIGLAALAGILFYASTVDGRPPLVERIGLSLHVSDDERLALTTTSVEVQFSEAVRAETAESAFRIEPEIDGEFSWSGPTLTFTPEDRLPLETDFAVRVEAGVVDEAGNRMAEPAQEFTFRTVGPPGIASTEPEDGAVSVPLDAQIVIEFNSLMDTASVEDALRIRPALAFEASWSAERLTLTPTGQLREGTRYAVSIGADARDSAGIPLESAFEFGFESAPAPIAPVQLVPADGSEGVAVSGELAVIFDREIDVDADLDDLFSIEPEVAGTLDVVVAPGAAGLVDPTPRVLSFEPSAALASNTTYRVTVATGLAAADGSQLAEELEWSFTTGAPLGTLSNQVVFLSDRAGIANVWAMNSDGSGQRQVTAELSPVIDYAVAPNGRSLVVGDGAVLVLMSADGTDRRLLTASDALEFDPAWAPDGSRFAFGRAELETGAGLGLWTRAADGGDDQALDLPQPSGGEPSPAPAASPGQVAASILRAPRYAPDGSALAFVDLAGRVGVLDLPAEELSMAVFAAVGPPVWLGDATGILVDGLSDAVLDPPVPGQPLPGLNAATLPLIRGQGAALQIVRLDRGAMAVDPLDLPAGASRPAASGDQLLFVAGGRLMLLADVDAPDGSRPLLEAEEAPVTSAAFGVERRSVVAARRAADSGATGGGIWLVDAVTGRAEQLSVDGWQPRWLP